MKTAEKRLAAAHDPTARHFKPQDNTEGTKAELREEMFMLLYC